MFDQFATLLFHSRDFAHKAHLATSSYSKHMALDEFYKELTKKIDKLIEVYQGRHGVQTIAHWVGAEEDIRNPTNVLEYHLKVLEGTRDAAIGNDRAIQNLMDDIVCVYLQTLYKLKTLA